MNDVKKPRLRKDRGLIKKLVTHEFFKMYKKKYPDSGIKDYTEMRAVLNIFHDTVTNIVSTERDGFKLFNIADMYVAGFFPKQEHVLSKMKFINYNLSNKADKPISYTNADTDGKVCKIFFSMILSRYGYKFRGTWGFVPCRGFKAKVSKGFKKDHNKFFTFIRDISRQDTLNKEDK